MNPAVLSETTSSMTTAFQGIADSITTGLGSIAPVALGVMAVILVWKVGTRFFKGMAK